jgi:Uma2 family endonuclease
VDGELLVTPSPGRTHQRVVSRLLVELTGYLDVERVGLALISPSDVELEPETMVQPDLYVLPAADAMEEFPARALLLAVEVLSSSTARYDRGTKRRLYQRSVPEYWIVDVDALLVERWRPGDARPEIVTAVLEWSPAGAASPFRLDLDAFFDRVTRGI